MTIRSRRPVPRDFVATGVWPDAELAGDDPASVFAAGAAQGLARNILDAIAGRSLRDVARSAGLSHQIVMGVLSGDRWVEVLALAKLERELGQRLWPVGLDDVSRPTEA